MALIIKENQLKQKELAAIMGVTESYVSTLLSGRNANISATVAALTEEKLGYNAQWVLNGREPKYKQISKNLNISDIHRKVIFQLEKMPDEQVRAVLAFIESLEKVESALKGADTISTK
jgi:transcriptional regulator with XRE-family HTH domain